jgi:hypothetical protein
MSPKEPNMTTTTFFSGSTPSTVTAKRPAATPQINKAVPAARAQRPVAGFAGLYPWMTQAMLAGMSPRARRLLRADC